MKLLSLANLSRCFWAAVLVTLSVTSFRYFPFLGSTTLVRPLAAYPLAILLLLLLIRWMRREIAFPWRGIWWPLALFLAAWLLSTAFGAALDPLPLRGQEYLARALRAWVTLGLGLAFFLAAVWMNQDEIALAFTVRWLLVGLVLTLLWSMVQMVSFYTPWLSIDTVREWQFLFSIRAPLNTGRVSGLAMEPSWLAAQLFTLYLPLFFAALLSRTSLSGRRWLDWTLGLSSLFVLLATYSRGGVLITTAALALYFSLFGRAELDRFWRWFWNGFRQGAGALTLRTAMLLGLVFALVMAGIFLARHPYFNALWTTRAENLNEYLIKIYAGPRFAYALSALAVWERSPFLGVGPGAAGFSMYSYLPEWSLTFVPEIAEQISPQSMLFPNPKNLYVRLLAESGWLGFSLFLIFWLALLGETISLVSSTGLRQVLARAGLFFFLAATLWNFTQDSLAQPNLWIIPGMVVGLAASFQQPRSVE